MDDLKETSNDQGKNGFLNNYYSTKKINFRFISVFFPCLSVVKYLDILDFQILFAASLHYEICGLRELRTVALSLKQCGSLYIKVCAKSYLCEFVLVQKPLPELS